MMTPIDVMFRVWIGEPRNVIALFPALQDGPGMCECFEHVGQHSTANRRLTMHHTRPALPAEYAELKAELEAAPYRYSLNVL